MIVLDLEFLQRSDKWSSPYPRIENFNERWWNDDYFIRDLGDEFDFIQLRGDGEILGRAMLSDAQPGDQYIGAPLEAWGKKIWFLKFDRTVKDAAMVPNLFECYASTTVGSRCLPTQLMMQLGFGLRLSGIGTM